VEYLANPSKVTPAVDFEQDELLQLLKMRKNAPEHAILDKNSQISRNLVEIPTTLVTVPAVESSFKPRNLG